MLFVPLVVLHETIEDEWHVVIKDYKFTIFGILRGFLFIVIYCLSMLSLHIESNNSMTKLHIILQANK